MTPYAGFWIRFAALLIDCIIIVPINTYILSYLDEGSIARLFVPNLIWWVYTAGLICSNFQATLGKKIIGLKVVGLDGERISFGRASGRWLASILSGFILGIGYLMVAFTDKKQGLHDMIAGTYVVKASSSLDDSSGSNNFRNLVSLLFVIGAFFFFLKCAVLSFLYLYKTWGILVCLVGFFTFPVSLVVVPFLAGFYSGNWAPLLSVFWSIACFVLASFAGRK